MVQAAIRRVFAAVREMDSPPLVRFQAVQVVKKVTDLLASGEAPSEVRVTRVSKSGDYYAPSAMVPVVTEGQCLELLEKALACRMVVDSDVGARAVGSDLGHVFVWIHVGVRGGGGGGFHAYHVHAYNVCGCVAVRGCRMLC